MLLTSWSWTLARLSRLIRPFTYIMQCTILYLTCISLSLYIYIYNIIYIYIYMYVCMYVCTYTYMYRESHIAVFRFPLCRFTVSSLRRLRSLYSASRFPLRHFGRRAASKSHVLRLKGHAKLFSLLEPTSYCQLMSKPTSHFLLSLFWFSFYSKCMCIYIYIHILVYIHIYIYICIYACVYIYIYTHNIQYIYIYISI